MYNVNYRVSGKPNYAPNFEPGKGGRDLKLYEEETKKTEEKKGQTDRSRFTEYGTGFPTTADLNAAFKGEQSEKGGENDTEMKDLAETLGGCSTSIQTISVDALAEKLGEVLTNKRYPDRNRKEPDRLVIQTSEVAGEKEGRDTKRESRKESFVKRGSDKRQDDRKRPDSRDRQPYRDQSRDRNSQKDRRETSRYRPDSRDRRPDSRERRPDSNNRRPYSGDRNNSSRDRRPYSGDRNSGNRNRRPDSRDRNVSRDRRPYSRDSRDSRPRDRRQDSRVRSYYSSGDRKGDRQGYSRERRPYSGDRKYDNRDRRSYSGDRNNRDRRPGSQDRRNFSRERGMNNRDRSTDRYPQMIKGQNCSTGYNLTDRYCDKCGTIDHHAFECKKYRRWSYFDCKRCNKGRRHWQEDCKESASREGTPNRRQQNRSYYTESENT